MAAPRLIPCALVLATLTLSACSSPAQGPGGGGQPVATGVAGQGGTTSPTSPASPAAVALTPDAYKGEIDSLRKPVRDALAGVSTARTVKTLDKRVERAEKELRTAADQLEAVLPPPEVQTQHTAYVAGLREVATELSSTLGKVGGRDICTASGVFTNVGGQLKALNTAGETLQQAGDYPADVVSVKSAAKQSRRLGNGAYIRTENRSGRSSLSISNGGSRDAVVTVLRGKSKAFSVYVRKKSKFKVNGVRDGSYRIFFTHGVDWDSKVRAFTRSCSFERFDKTVKFRTTYTSTQILWHDWRITLHTVAGGNAPTREVDPGEFPS